MLRLLLGIALGLVAGFAAAQLLPDAPESASLPLQASGDRLTIGTTLLASDNSAGRLEVVGDESFRVALRAYAERDADDRADVNFFRARGTETNPRPVQVGDTLGGLLWDAYTNRTGTPGWAEGARISAVVEAEPGAYTPTSLRFHTSTHATNFLERLRITDEGRVGINTTAPNAQLDVRGSVAAHALHLEAAETPGVGAACAKPGEIRFAPGPEGDAFLACARDETGVASWRALSFSGD